MDKGEAIRKAVDCYDEKGNLMGFHNIEKVDFLVDFLLDQSPIKGDKYRISDERLEKEMRILLGNIHNADNILGDFEKGVGDIKQKLGTMDWTQYTIVFPLNFPADSMDFPNSVTILGTDIQQIEKKRWKDQYLTKAQDTPVYEDWINKSQNNPLDPIYTYWLIEYEAADLEYVTSRIDEIIEGFLGQLNFAINAKNQKRTLNESPWHSSWSELITPFMFLVFSDEKYINAPFSTDLRPRKEISLKERDKRQLESWMERFYEFSPALTDVEELLLSGFSSYQRAMSQTDRTECFLAFWRGIEHLTQSTPNDSSLQVIERAKSSYISIPEDLFEERLRWLKCKRNKVVHGETGTKISQSDINIIKGLFEDLIGFYMAFEDVWSKEDFNFVFESGYADEESLKHRKIQREQKIRQHEREIRIIEQRLSRFEK